jgi:hypothetical protein
VGEWAAKNSSLIFVFFHPKNKSSYLLSFLSRQFTYSFFLPYFLINRLEIRGNYIKNEYFKKIILKKTNKNLTAMLAESLRRERNELFINSNLYIANIASSHSEHCG